jgi:hypothetical protein
MQIRGGLAALAAIVLCASFATASASPHKPSAPVDVRLETQPVGGTAYDVTLVVTPRRNVKGLVLVLDGRTLDVGALAAGKSRTMTTRITLGAGGRKDIVGSASVDVGGHRRRAAALAHLGTPAAASSPPVHIVRLPDGTEAAEVRP